MSDADNKHESLIKTPKQLILAIFLAFVVPIAVIVLLVTYVGNGNQVGVGGNSTEEATNERIRPVATLEIKDTSGPRVYKTGEQIYQQICAACHAAGVAGAPKFGEAGAWHARLALGYTGLMNAVLHGKNAMPARGGASPDDVSDYELARAMVYMVNASGGKLNEPPEPKAAPASAGSASPDADAVNTQTLSIK